MKKNTEKTGVKRSLLAREWVHWIIALLFMLGAYLLASYHQMGRIEAVLFVAAGALAGYFTNDLAITLLLWPTEKRLKGLLHGIFFKRRDEFGDALIQSACQRFLNDRLFNDIISSQTVENALSERISSSLDKHMQVDFGEPKSVLNKLFDDQSRQGEFVDRVAAWSGDQVSKSFFAILDEKFIYNGFKLIQGSTNGSALKSLLGDETDLKNVLNKCLPIIINRLTQDFVPDAVSRLAEKIRSSDKKLQAFFTPQVRHQIETSLQKYVETVVVDGVQQKLEDPGIRRQMGIIFQNEVENLAENYFNQLPGIKGWLLKVFGESDIRALIDDIPARVDGFLLRFIATAKSGLLNRYVAEQIAEQFPKIWQLKISDICDHLPDGLIQQGNKMATKLIKSEVFHSMLIDGIADRIRSWKEELQLSDLPPDGPAGSDPDKIINYISKKLAQLLQKQRVQDRLNREVRIMIRIFLIRALNQPVGSLANLSVFNGDNSKALTTSLVRFALEKFRGTVPELVRYFPVEKKLRGLWNKLSNREIQKLVWDVLSTEFQILINLGISFGSFVAFILITVQNLAGPFKALCLLVIFIPIYKFCKYRMRLNR